VSFKQLSINIDSAHAEILSEIFFSLGALSVSIEDQYEGTSLEQPIFNEPGMEAGELWQHSKLTVLLEHSYNIPDLVSTAQLQFSQPFEYKVTEVQDQDWVRLTQSQFEPIKVSSRLYIVPTWHALPAAPAVNVILDPGLAFGTGSHPTTLMCLRYLAAQVGPRMEILDYGCGSGILAISAKKLGAVKVCGVDIDPQALEASNYNAQLNQVAVDFYLSDHFPGGEFDLVVANILSNPLRLLAAALAKYVRLGGRIVLSGILASQTTEMTAIYANWFKLEVVALMDGWVCLQGVRNA
jgi:ribosomal protein L11 methyltransferase